MRKIVDSDENISKGGRAEKYHRNKELVPNNSRFTENNNPKVNMYDILKKYQLKGFEFGNWVNNNDRVDRLVAINSSLRDLSIIMKTTNIGMSSLIGIAFGARGTNAGVAHYEPFANMINLTKKYGIAALSHEYGHALDYNFGLYIDQNKDYPSLSGGKSRAKKLPNNQGGKIRYVANLAIDSFISTDSYKAIEKSNNKNKEYFLQRNEIFARLFEMWVAYKLKRKGIQNYFLSMPFQEYCTSKVYLTEKEFIKIAPVMDKLIDLFSKTMQEKAPKKKTKTIKKKVVNKQTSLF